MELADACGPGRRPVTGDDALDARFLGGLEEGALGVEDEPVHTADQDVDAGEDLRELLLRIRDVPRADLDSGRAESVRRGLGERCRADQGGDTLESQHMQRFRRQRRFSVMIFFIRGGGRGYAQSFQRLRGRRLRSSQCTLWHRRREREV